MGTCNAPRRQADRSTRAHAQVHRKLLYGHQGIRHIISHLREPACFMGPHGCRLTCALEVHFWCQLRILARRQFGVVRPMCQSGGSYVCKTVLWLAIGLNTVQQTAEACLAAAGLMYCEFGCRLASYGPPTALGVCIEHCPTAAGVCCPVVSGVTMGPSAYTNNTAPSPGCEPQGMRPW